MFLFTTWPSRSLWALGRACPQASSEEPGSPRESTTRGVVPVPSFKKEKQQKKRDIMKHVTCTYSTRRLLVFTSSSEILFLESLSQAQREQKPFNLKIRLAGNGPLRPAHAPRAAAISPQWLPSIKMWSVPDRHTQALLKFWINAPQSGSFQS